MKIEMMMMNDLRMRHCRAYLFRPHSYFSKICVKRKPKTIKFSICLSKPNLNITIAQIRE